MNADLMLHEQMCSNEPIQVEAATRLLTQRVKVIAGRFVSKNSGNQMDVDDVVQETVIAVWKNMRRGSYKPMPDTPLDAYLYKIVKNTWLKMLGEQPEGMTEPMRSLPEELPAEHYRLDELQRAFGQLEQACQNLLKMVYWDGYKLEKIAILLGITVEAVKMRKYRCMRMLGALLRKDKP